MARVNTGLVEAPGETSGQHRELGTLSEAVLVLVAGDSVEEEPELEALLRTLAGQGNLDPITPDQVREGIRTMPRRKACGIDHWSVEELQTAASRSMGVHGAHPQCH